MIIGYDRSVEKREILTADMKKHLSALQSHYPTGFLRNISPCEAKIKHVSLNNSK